MGSPLKSPNGHTPVRATPVKDARRVGLVTRVASWLVNVATPKLMPDHLTTLRRRARNADDRLERTARRLVRRPANRVPAHPDGRSR